MGTANVILYAQWTLIPTYTVTYDGNTNTGGTVPVDSNNYVEGATVTVLGNTGLLEKTGYTFNGWNTAADGTGISRAPASTFAMGTANVILYAQWTGGEVGRCGTWTNITDPAGSSLTITVPAVESGKFLIAQIVCYAGDKGITAPSDWTYLTEMPGDQNGLRQSIYYKIATSSDETVSTHTWSTGDDSNITWAGGIMCYTNVDTSRTPIYSVNSADSATLTATSIDSVTAGSMVIAYFGVKEAEYVFSNLTSTMEERYRYDDFDLSNDLSILAADEVQSSTGSTGYKEISYGKEDKWVAHLVVLEPATP